MDLTDSLLSGVSGRLAEHRPAINPFGEFLVLVVIGWLVVVIGGIVVSDGVIANLPENVDLPPRFARHIIGQIGTKAKRGLHGSVEFFDSEFESVAFFKL